MIDDFSPPGAWKWWQEILLAHPNLCPHVKVTYEFDTPCNCHVKCEKTKDGERVECSCDDKSPT